MGSISHMQSSQEGAELDSCQGICNVYILNKIHIIKEILFVGLDAHTEVILHVNFFKIILIFHIIVLLEKNFLDFCS